MISSLKFKIKDRTYVLYRKDGIAETLTVYKVKQNEQTLSTTIVQAPLTPVILPGCIAGESLLSQNTSLLMFILLQIDTLSTET